MLALCVGTYANDTDVSVDRPAEIPTEITYTPYNTICSLLVPVIRGVFFRVAPPIYRTDDPPNNEKSLCIHAMYVMHMRMHVMSVFCARYVCMYMYVHMQTCMSFICMH